MENKNYYYLTGIIGGSLIIAALVFGLFFYNARSDSETLAVTGQAKTQIKSDLAKWQSNFSRTVTIYDLKIGYAQMNKDLSEVKNFFKNNGVSEDKLTISPVFMDEVYKYNQYESGPKEYTLRQTVELQLADVDKVTELAKKTNEIISQGVIYSAMPVEYFYSKLSETRMELLGKAVQDAKARALKIAESSGGKLSQIKSVTVGVTQVMPVNSTDVTDYGTYDTSTINKEVTITVKASFNLK